MKTLVKAKILLLLLIILGISCKKDPADTKDPETKPNGQIMINGKAYGTVKIGNQVWTSVNYEGPGGIAYTGNTEKPEYGRYYSFSEIQNISIPANWRIPTEADFKELTTTLGIVFENGTVTNPKLIKKLSSKTNWSHVQGTNESGFNAYPGGYSVNNSAPIDGDLSEFWMADGKTFCIMESGNLTSYRIVFFANSNQPNDRFNLRFVRDAN